MRARNLALIVAVTIALYGGRDLARKGLHDLSHLLYTPPPQASELIRENIRPTGYFTERYLSNVGAGDIIVPTDRHFLVQLYNSRFTYGFGDSQLSFDGMREADYGNYDLILIREWESAYMSNVKETAPIKDPTAVIYRQDGIAYIHFNFKNPRDTNKLKLFKHSNEWGYNFIMEVLEEIAKTKNGLLEKLLQQTLTTDPTSPQK